MAVSSSELTDGIWPGYVAAMASLLLSLVLVLAVLAVTYTYTPVSGDTIQLYVNGVATGAAQTAVSGSNNFTLNAANLGEDGNKIITVRVTDSASNRSKETTAKIVTLDTKLAQGFASSSFADLDSNGVDAGDTVTLVFNEKVDLSTAGLDAKFGSGATATAVAAVNGLSNTWTITLGSTPASLDGAAITLTGVKDVVGNQGGVAGVANLAGTLGGDLTNQAGTPVVGNVSTDNVVSSTAESNTVRIGVTNLDGTDTVKLYLDGVELTGLTETARTTGVSGFVDLTIPAGSWGADGQRLLTASVSRSGGGTVTSELGRSVYVASDDQHWSTATGANSVIWFDPDTLMGSVAKGAAVSSWTASSGGSVATVPTDAKVSGGPMVTSANGHLSLQFSVNGTQFNVLQFTDPNSIVWDSTDVNGAYLTTLVSASNYQGSPLAVGYGAAQTRNGKSQGIKVGTLGTQLLYTNYGVIDVFSPLNTVSSNQTATVAMRTSKNGTAWSFQGYYNGVLSTTDATTLNMQTAPTLMRIGAQANDSGLNSVDANFGAFRGEIQDVIWFNTSINNNLYTEVETYLASKYRYNNNLVVDGTGWYRGEVSNSSASIINDYVVLNAVNTNDKVKVAGSDYVNTGAGNDIVQADDLKFRNIDGGQGFDTFALSSAYNTAVSRAS